MAMGLAPITRVNISFVDKDNNHSTVGVNYPSTMAHADVITTVEALVASMDAISTAPIEGFTITTVYTDPDINFNDAPETSDVERKGRFVFETVNGFKSSISIPSIDPALVIDGTNTINTAEVLITSFETLMLNSALGAGNSPVTPRGEDFVSRAAPPVKVHKKNENG